MNGRVSEIIVRNIVESGFLSKYINEEDYKSIVCIDKYMLNCIDELEENEVNFLDRIIKDDDILLQLYYTHSKCKNFNESFLFIIREDLDTSLVFDITYEKDSTPVDSIFIVSGDARKELIHGLYYERLKKEIEEEM